MNTIRVTQHIALACTLAALATAATAQADEIRRGHTLHEANCVSCHASMAGGDGSGLYTRTDRRVNSHSQLVTQVNRCETTLGLQWFQEDVKAVVEYLNKNYYQF